MGKSTRLMLFTVCYGALLLTGCGATLGNLAGNSGGKTSSPDGRVQLNVFKADNGRLSYTVDFNDKPAIESSPLGLTVGGIDLGANASLGSGVRSSHNEQYPWRGAKSVATNNYRETQFPVTPAGGKSYQLIVRVFNDGVAFRYVFTADAATTVSEEQTAFKLPEGSTAWWAATRKQFDYEGRYSASKISEIKAETKIAPPTTIELPGGGYAALTEGNLVNFGGMHYVAKGDRSLQAEFQHGFQVEGRIETPWRIVMLANDLNGLVNCDIVHNVCPAPSPELADASWIKSGKSTWSFLGGGGQGLENQKLYSKLAGQLGFEYNLVDAGWERWPDKWNDLKGLVDLANGHHVKTMVWKSKSSLAKPEVRREFFQHLVDCGVVGVKIDFLDSELKDAVDFQTATLKDAADFKLMIIFHGCNKPTGIERTWPNEMGREGIAGLEKRPPWAMQNTILPFTRLLAGHADFTPMSFKETKIVGTTWAHQIATVICYTTSIQNVGADPQNILDNPAADFIKAIPVDWDETIVLSPSKIGSLLAFARRKGNDWWICVQNGDEKNARNVQLDLPFLKGHYEAAVVSDNLEKPFALEQIGERFGPGDAFHIRMLAGGGWAARLVPSTK